MSLTPPSPRPHIFDEANVISTNTPRSSTLAFIEYYDQETPSTSNPRQDELHLMPSDECSGPKDFNQPLVTSSSSQGYAGASLQPNHLLSHQHLDCPASPEERAPNPPNISSHQANGLSTATPLSSLAFLDYYNDQDMPSPSLPQLGEHHLTQSYGCSGPLNFNQLLFTPSSSQTPGYAGGLLQPNYLLSHQHLAGCPTSWEERASISRLYISFHQANGISKPCISLDTPSPSVYQRDEHHLMQSCGCSSPSSFNPQLITSSSSQTSGYAGGSLQPNDHLMNHSHLAQNDHQPLQKPLSKDQKYRRRLKEKEQAKDRYIKTQDQEILRLTGELAHLRLENEMLRKEIILIKGKNRRSH